MALKIYIKDLVVSGKHGVHPHEKETTQRFKISVELILADDSAAVSDSLEDTIDWSKLRDEIAVVIEENSYNLIEGLAQKVANVILKDKRITEVLVSIDKLDAFPSGVPGITLEVKRT